MNAQCFGRLGLSLAAALLGGALAPSAFGQASTAGEAVSGPPLYSVEIIVFAYNQGDPSEEDFPHIARRESAEASAGPAALAEFDFSPFVPEQYLTDDPSAQTSDDASGPASDGSSRAIPDSSAETSDDSSGEIPADSGPARSPLSRLLLGDDAATDDAASDPAATDDSGENAAVGPAPADGGLAGGAEAEVVIDPFGNHPGNAVAPFRFRLLAQNELELTDLRRRLERVESVYTPLVHGGWIQEGLPPQQARPFDLAYLGASRPSGTIRLHVSRFLHLTLDLDYRAFSPSGAAPIPNETRPRDGAFGVDNTSPVLGAARPTLAELEGFRSYHLGAERRMRSGEIHYFDHPFFGVIAVVRPYEPPEPPPTEGVRPAA